MVAAGSGSSVGNVTWPPDSMPAVGVGDGTGVGVAVGSGAGVGSDPPPQATTRKGTAARARAATIFDRPKGIFTPHD